MEEYCAYYYHEEPEKQTSNPDLKLAYNLSSLSKKQLFIEIQKANAIINQVMQEDIKYLNRKNYK